MTYGQGASLALPIWAKYMNKIYARPELGYSQEEKFDIPDDFNPCSTKTYDEEVNVGHGLDDLFN